MQWLEDTLPQDVPHVFISAVTGQGLQQLKDLLWVAMNSESNKLHDIQSERIVHKDKDVSYLQYELTDLGEDEDLRHWGEEPDEDDLELDWDDEDGEPEEVEWDDVEDLEDFEYEDPEDSEEAK